MESSVSWSDKEPMDTHKNLDNLSSSRANNKLPGNSFKIGNIIHYIILNYFVSCEFCQSCQHTYVLFIFNF